MILAEIPLGSRVRVKLKKRAYAGPQRVGNSVVYSTARHAQAPLPHKPKGMTFTEGVGTILENSNKKIKMSFIGLVNPDFSGIVEIDYFAFDSVYLWEGETNESTLTRSHKIDFNLVEEIEHKNAMPPMDIYRKEIQLIWKDEK